MSGSGKKCLDYGPLGGSVVIPAGDISAGIRVIAEEDSEAEWDEYVVVHISDSTLYNSHPKNSASILIQDSMPIVELALNGDPEAPEGGGATRMTLSRNDASAEIEVNLSISGTANNQSDYVSIGTLYTSDSADNKLN